MTFSHGFATEYLDPVRGKRLFEELPGRFPELCRLETLPYETHGYWGERQDLHGRQNMAVLVITAGDMAEAMEKPAVLLFRSPHAREWINGMSVTEAALQLLEAIEEF